MTKYLRNRTRRMSSMTTSMITTMLIMFMRRFVPEKESFRPAYVDDPFPDVSSIAVAVIAFLLLTVAMSKRGATTSS